MTTAHLSTDVRSHMGKLAECDESLSSIAFDMTQLQDELAQFRTDASRLAHLLSEQRTSLDEQESALSRLENEKTVEQQRADRASAELHHADARVKERDRQVAMLERKVQALRTAIADRARTPDVASAEDSGGRARATQERALGDSPADRRIAGHVLFIASPGGYSLSDSDGPCPGPGELVAIAGNHFLVTRTGPSPLPGDKRPCAFLVLGE